MSDGEVLPGITATGKIPKILLWIKEADTRIVVHIDCVVHVKRYEQIVVASNDADSFPLLHYTPYFKRLGMEEIWQAGSAICQGGDQWSYSHR